MLWFGFERDSVLRIDDPVRRTPFLDLGSDFGARWENRIGVDVWPKGFATLADLGEKHPVDVMLFDGHGPRTMSGVWGMTGAKVLIWTTGARCSPPFSSVLVLLEFRNTHPSPFPYGRSNHIPHFIQDRSAHQRFCYPSGGMQTTLSLETTHSERPRRHSYEGSD